MKNRIIDISDTSGKLRMRNAQLVFERDGEDKPITAPIEDLAALIVSNPRITYSHGLLAALAEGNVALIICDGRFTPAGVMLPLAGHSLQTERLALQINAPLPMRKRLWQSVVQAKIRAQAALLEDLREGDGGLRALAARVGSGDPANVEAQAARRYWSLLFADPDFRRSPEGGGINPILNYGYAIVRSITARAVCGSGLHPSIGLHHHNRHNPFCLADDLMEPFRPLVDRQAVEILGEFGPEPELIQPVKRRILTALTGEMELNGESRTVFDCLARLSASLADAFARKRKDLELPTS